MFDNVNPPQAQMPQPNAGSMPPIPSVPQPQASPIAAPPQPLADMFAGLDAGLGSPISPSGLNPIQPGITASGMSPEPAGSGRKYFIVGFLVLLLIGIIVGGYFAYAKFSAMVNKDKEQPAVVEVPVETEKPVDTIVATTTQPAGEPLENIATSTAATSSPLAPETATTSPLATSTTAAEVADRTKDSDNDGLTDYEELNFYYTNTNVADTDGDGFTDGSEVKNGFNPLGAGKMIDNKIKPSATQ